MLVAVSIIAVANHVPNTFFFLKKLGEGPKGAVCVRGGGGGLWFDIDHSVVTGSYFESVH